MARKDIMKNEVQKKSILSGITAILIFLTTFIIILFLGISAGYDFGYQLFASPAVSSPPGREVTIEVKKGETTEEIADKLVDAGLIRSKVNFLCQKLFYKKYLLPGEYTLNTAMTSKEILLILDDGPSS